MQRFRLFFAATMCRVLVQKLEASLCFSAVASNVFSYFLVGFQASQVDPPPS